MSLICPVLSSFNLLQIVVILSVWVSPTLGIFDPIASRKRHFGDSFHMRVPVHEVQDVRRGTVEERQKEHHAV